MAKIFGIGESSEHRQNQIGHQPFNEIVEGLQISGARVMTPKDIAATQPGLVKAITKDFEKAREGLSEGFFSRDSGQWELYITVAGALPPDLDSSDDVDMEVDFPEEILEKFDTFEELEKAKNLVVELAKEKKSFKEIKEALEKLKTVK